jgi:hypothetical protein
VVRHDRRQVAPAVYHASLMASLCMRWPLSGRCGGTTSAGEPAPQSSDPDTYAAETVGCAYDLRR